MADQNFMPDPMSTPIGDGTASIGSNTAPLLPYHDLRQWLEEAKKLGEVREVAVPDDPATGKPFVYRRAGAAAILHGPQAGLRAPLVPYRITIRPAH